MDRSLIQDPGGRGAGGVTKAVMVGIELPGEPLPEDPDDQAETAGVPLFRLELSMHLPPRWRS